MIYHKKNTRCHQQPLVIFIIQVPSTSSYCYFCPEIKMLQQYGSHHSQGHTKCTERLIPSSMALLPPDDVLQDWRWGQYVSLKCRYLPTSADGIATQIIIIIIFTTVRTSNPTNSYRKTLDFGRLLPNKMWHAIKWSKWRLCPCSKNVFSKVALLIWYYNTCWKWYPPTSEYIWHKGIKVCHTHWRSLSVISRITFQILICKASKCVNYFCSLFVSVSLQVSHTCSDSGNMKA
jgi:hypothetical protein